MQKKSLLVALFCGALCLTGCLKNEESASVVQVRNAKANELNSIAKLNEAKAAAEAVYAEAELTLAKAEAELKKAEANLVNAQAETEKVRAELLKVQVELAEVLVEEEKVKLQLMEANLESRLIALEVEMAAAEAAKQGWVNVLNNLKAQAEVDAIENEMTIVALSQQMDSLILTVEGAKADSAKVYADLYFKALNEVAVAQAELVAAKATRVLLNREALDVREAIHDEIDKKNEQIAQNEAYIAELKTYQDMDVEEAKAKLEEARIELNKAYNDWKEKCDILTKAQGTLADANGKKADFNNKGAAWPFETNIKGQFPIWMVDNQNVKVKVGDATVDVLTTGILIPSPTNEGKTEFLPLWNAEQTIPKTAVRYPSVDVYHETTDPWREDFVTLNADVLAPAAINYDNVKVALDTAVAIQQRWADMSIAGAEWWMSFQIADREQTVAKYTEYNKLQQKYVNARKANVEEKEKAFKAEIGKYETYVTEREKAWKAFEEYMLLKTDVSRKYFVDQYMADTAYAKAYKDSAAAAFEWATAGAGIPTLKDAVEDAFQAAAKAQGQLDSLKNRRTIDGTLAKKTWTEYNTAKNRWNPDFAKAVESGATLKLNGAVPADPKAYKSGDDYVTDPGYQNLNPASSHWSVSVEGKTYYASTTQDSLLTANYNLRIASAKLYEADVDSLRKEIKKETYDAIAAEYQARYKDVNGSADIDGAKAVEASAKTAFGNAEKAYNKEIGSKIAAAEEAWNPAIAIFDVVTFPTEARPETRGYKYTYVKTKVDKDGVWCDGEAGTTQVALFNAVKEVKDALDETEIPETNPGQKEEYTTGEAYYLANAAAISARANFINKSKALMKAFGVKDADFPTNDDELFAFIEENIGDYIDEEANKLYKAFLNVKNESKYWEALGALWEAYLGFNPDQIGKWESHPGDEVYTNSGIGNPNAKSAEFGWLVSSYNVDYEATYLNMQGEEEPIAWILYPWKQDQFTHSFAYIIEAAQNDLDVTFPEAISNLKTMWANYIKDYKTKVAGYVSTVNSYKSLETGYKNWVAERVADQKAVNEATKDEFDARLPYLAAKAKYDALKAVVDKDVWVYTGENPNKNDGFVKMDVYQTIDWLEKQNKRLEGDIEDARQALSDGKKALAYVNEIIDEAIEVLSERIEIMNAIALKYKAIMNAYLGIVEEGVDAEPVEVEGDEE